MKRFFICSLVSCLLVSSLLFSQIPQTLSYQGVLKDAGGNIVPNGTYQLTFRIYTVFSGGSALWTETQMVPVGEGVFDVILGSVTTLNLAFDVPYWLGITVGTGAELSPRIQLTSSAYSMNSKSVVNSAVTTAKLADGAVTLPKISSSGASSGNVITYDGSNLVWQSPASGGIGGSGTVDYIPKFSGTSTLTNSNIRYNSTWGGIGIGASPEGTDSKLLVQHNIASFGTPPPYLLRCRIRSSTLPFIYTDLAYVEGDGDGYFKGRLVVGSTNPDTNATIYCENNESSGRGIIARGYLRGISGVSYGPYGFGVYGVSDYISGFSYGVAGYANDLGYAIYAMGRLAATGTKSFHIDHPLDPQNKYLNHYCAEGPEPLNIYRGNIILDSEGEAWVDLPSFFETINKDWSYTLTAVGAPMPNLHVSQKIQNNQFKIAGGQPGMEVSWRVEAVRNDRWVEKYGAPVEQDKPEGHRGKYLNPELYGQPESMGVFYEPERKVE